MKQFPLKEIQKLVEWLLHIRKIRKYPHQNSQEGTPSSSFSLRSKGFIHITLAFKIPTRGIDLQNSSKSKRALYPEDSQDYSKQRSNSWQVRVNVTIARGFSTEGIGKNIHLLGVHTHTHSLSSYFKSSAWGLDFFFFFKILFIYFRESRSTSGGRG